MGVQGLWELLTPVGRRISVDALGSRKLAVDSSIWIIQFMKAMRDDKGDMITNAHLLGFFRRICKLLFLRIKPVFVFDGATPALKRRTVLARRRQREKAQSKIRKTAEKLLFNHLRMRKLEEMASGVSLDPQSVRKERTGGIDNIPSGTYEQPVASDVSASKLNYDREATDALLAATLAAEDEILHNGGESPERSGEGSDDEDDGEEQLILPVSKGLDPSVLASLPPSMQLDLLVQMREQLVVENRQKFQKVATVPSSFSQMQIQAYLKTVAFRREINEVQKAAASGGIGGVPTDRVASTTDREFIFSKSFEGDKLSLFDIEGQRRLEQSNLPTTVTAQRPSQLTTPLSGFFSSVKTKQDKEDEDGTISLVSTELNERRDSDSNSVVHTYVDERGHVRVNRRRGMGVRMTRDLQWNLYLMQDVEARKSGDNAIVGIAEPPIIPSSSPEVVLDEISMPQHGIEVSFVDDGTSSAFAKDDDGDFFEELVLDVEEGNHKFVNNSADVMKSDTGVITSEHDDEEEWEDGGTAESKDNGGVIDEEDLAEALRLSLSDQNVGQSSQFRNQSASSGESEVEWEDGTGAVSVSGFDMATTNRNVSGMPLLPSEEAEIEEAICRSLEDFGLPGKSLPQLVIKEPSDNDSSTTHHDLQVLPDHSLLVHSEEDSEELHLARERARKGKAIVDGDEKSTFRMMKTQEVVKRQPSTMSEQEQIAALTLSEMPVIEANMQGPARVIENSVETVSPSSIDFRSIIIPIAAEDITEKSEVGISRGLLEVELSEAEMNLSDGNISRQNDGKTSAEVFKKGFGTSLGETLVIKRPLHQDEGFVASNSDKELIHFGESKEADYREAVSHGFTRQEDNHGLKTQRDGNVDAMPLIQLPHSKLRSGDNEVDIRREAIKTNLVMERGESVLTVEREQLARESAELQAALVVEQQEVQAGLDRERELLAQEEMELRSEQKKNERNADSVTGDMFAEVQELLQMFGVPYIIAPMEAEAQCAYMDTIDLVDGIVTDDSDAFLFGGKTVYRNLFDDRKYVEAFCMKDLESEMGMTRDKLIQIAMLLGSDYTEGISGIGIVNAMEVVNAFPEIDGLQKFKEWLDSPDHELFQKMQAPLKTKGKGIRKGENTGLDEGSDVNHAAEPKLTSLQLTFIAKHRAVSKNWNIPESFPSEAVVSAYMDPAVDKSAEKFSWGRPDLDALRRFCNERFMWNKEKSDELLMPVLKEYDRGQIQTRLESFYHFEQRFAKIRSTRIQKAVTGITGKRSAELMELSPHLLSESPPKKPPRKRKNMNKNLPSPSGGAETSHEETGGGPRGRQKQNSEQAEDTLCVEPIAENAENEMDVSEATTSTRGRFTPSNRGRGRGISRGRGRGRSRGRGRGNAAMEEEEGSISGSSDSDDIVDSQQILGSLNRSANDNQQLRRSTRQRSKVTKYCRDSSDEEVGGDCSDGDELITQVDFLVAEAMQKKLEREGSEMTSFAVDRNSAIVGSEVQESTRFTNSAQTKAARLAECNEFETGGGFCPSEEDESVHQDSTDHLINNVGGGLCFRDKFDPSPRARMLRGDISEAHPCHSSGGVVYLPEDTMQLPDLDRHLKDDSCNPSELTDIGNQGADCSLEQNKRSLVPDISVTDQVLGEDESRRPAADLGLRAMPLMRRKKRRSFET